MGILGNHGNTATFYMKLKICNMNECEKWLLEFLGKETRLVEDVREEAKKKGFKKHELKAAKQNLGVKTFHQFDEDGATENWFWYLP